MCTSMRDLAEVVRVPFYDTGLVSPPSCTTETYVASPTLSSPHLHQTTKMSSPPALSPPGPSNYNPSHKRRISLPVHQQGLSQKKPKTSAAGTPTPGPSRKGSVVSQHPLRQTSFPPPVREHESVAGGSVRGGGAPSIVAGAGGGDDEEDEDAGRDDYGTETVLADGGTGGFAEDDEEKKRMAYLPSPPPLSFPLLLLTQHRILLEAFDTNQNARYESFRRANLNKAAVKKLANSVLSQSVTANVGTVICGFSKVFTGEIIEMALQIQRSWGDEGPLLPDHLREAWRRYRIERHGAMGYRGAVGGGSPVATGGGPGVGDVIGGGVGRLFR